MKRTGLIALLLLAATPAWAQPGPHGGHNLAAADADGDGQITRAEAQAARAAMFERLDADHDGYITEAERTAAREQHRPRRGMAMLDTDSDGRISRAEHDAAPMRMFDRHDANGDGVLSAEEIQAAQAARPRAQSR